LLRQKVPLIIGVISMFDNALPDEAEIVLALDVGKVTGAAIWVTCFPDSVITSEIPTRYMVRDMVEDLILFNDNKVTIACENFVISQRTIKTAQDHNALRLIGWLDLFCDKHNIDFKLRTAASAKSFATDDKLKILDWYTSTKDGHANDASRHMILQIRDSYPEVFATNILPQLAKVLLK
jgi:hypothetical protein